MKLHVLIVRDHSVMMIGGIYTNQTSEFVFEQGNILYQNLKETKGITIDYDVLEFDGFDALNVFLQEEIIDCY